MHHIKTNLSFNELKALNYAKAEVKCDATNNPIEMLDQQKIKIDIMIPFKMIGAYIDIPICLEPTRESKIKYRPVRELLSEAMENAKDFNTIDEMFDHISKDWNNHKLKIESYSERPDYRIGWDRTNIIMAVDKNTEQEFPVGFCDVAI